MSYRLAEDTQLIHHARVYCSKIVKRVEPLLREDGISSQAKLVGSAGRGLITFNGNNRDFDFDYNLFVRDGIECDPEWLYNQVHIRFNQSLNENLGKDGLCYATSVFIVSLGNSPDAHASTSALSSKPMMFYNAFPPSKFHIDLAIITEFDGYWNRLKFDKTSQQFIWNRMANIDAFKRREASLTKQELEKLPEVYVGKKNLHINDKENFPSFKCYIEAVNEIYYGSHN